MTGQPGKSQSEGLSGDDLRNFYPGDRSAIEELRQKGLAVGLIAVSYGNIGTAWTEHGDVEFAVAGRLRLSGKQEVSGLPVAGDWVVLRQPDAGGPWLVQEILPRTTEFNRKMAGAAHRVQVVAANMDIIFIVSSLNRDFNSRRLERYLALTAESGAKPVIVLTKSDLAGDELESYLEEASEIDDTVPVHAVSVVTGDGLDDLNQYLKPGVMVALLGSSGVGKSTLINHWLGEERLRVNEVRNDERGRHTTTHRELIVLPGGTVVLDTPGMREVQLLDHVEGLDEAFEDILLLASECRFTDCRHENEPGCAIIQAIDEDRLDEDRFEHYQLLRLEVEEAERKKLEMDRKRQARSSRRPRR